MVYRRPKLSLITAATAAIATAAVSPLLYDARFYFQGNSHDRSFPEHPGFADFVASCWIAFAVFYSVLSPAGWWIDSRRELRRMKAEDERESAKGDERNHFRRAYLNRWASGGIVPAALAKAARRMQERRERRWQASERSK